MIKYYASKLKNKIDYKVNRKKRILELLSSIDSNSYVTKIRDKSNLPIESLIEITNGCNLNCLMCSTHSSTRKVGFIKESLFEKIIIDLKKVGINSAGLHTVGETFLHPKLKNLLEICKKHDFTAIISTNGQFSEKIKILSNDYNIVYRFSIDGANKETFEKIRKGAKWEKILESLNVVKNINMKSIVTYLPSSISCCLSNDNIDEVFDFFDVFSEYCPPENISFSLINGLSPETEYFNQNFSYPNLITINKPCSLPFNSLYFTYDGKATLCCRDYNAELTVGSIEEDNIEKLWHSNEAEKIRKFHLEKDPKESLICSHCYFPYDFVNVLVNEYIQFIRSSYSNLTNKQKVEMLNSFILDLNNTIDLKNMSNFKQIVMKKFKLVK